MATAAGTATPARSKAVQEEVQGFDPVVLRAPFALRCAAMSVDYLTLIMLPAAWLFSGRLFGDGASSVSLGTGVWIVAIIIFAINFLLLPLLRGQSLGKMVTGLTILDIAGRPASVGKLLIRNTLGYLLTATSGGLGFLLSAFNSSGRTLHDFLAGTIVIKGRKS